MTRTVGRDGDYSLKWKGGLLAHDHTYYMHF